LKIFVSLAVGLTLLTPARQEPEYVSPLGKTYYSRVARQELIDAIEAKLADPADRNALIEAGQSYAELRRFRRAIEIYSRGIEEYPDWAPLYRDRGHRYISLREFEPARQDLQTAARLDPDSFEILFHLGLADYLAGDFTPASVAYQEALDVARSDDDRVAGAYWLYLALRRSEREEDVRKLMESVGPGMRVENNVPYLNLLLLYKGLKSPEELLDADRATEVELATYGYGVAMWHLFRGDKREAGKLFERIVAGPHWTAFGFIAAEAELTR
jgi:tetratricopeptide (TPR) repeat protein